MKRNKKTILLSLLFMILVLGFTISYAVSPIQQAKIVAGKELPKLKTFIDEHYKEFHFDSLEDLENAYLGEPISNYVIHNFDSSKSIEEQMEGMPFYVFPVMVDGKAITDVTVMLENKQWKVVDIGGHLSTLIQDSKVNDKLTDIKILRFNGNTLVLGNKNNKRVGFFPYNDDEELEIKKAESVNIEQIEKAIKKMQKQIKEMQNKNDDGEIIYIGAVAAPVSVAKLEFKQESVINRLVKYMANILYK